MASNPPMENGAILGLSHPNPGEGAYPVPQTGPTEDTLQQMNVLMKENRELKEALKQTNASMKERFENLAAWKEKQKEERDFLEGKLEEAKERVSILTKRSEELRKRLQVLEGAEGAGEGVPEHCSSEVETLKAQIARLLAEKSDLVAMNSELELKMRSGSPEDSFVEIRIAQEGGVDVTKDLANGPKDSQTPSHVFSRHNSEEQTVSQLLQSLRKETQRVEKLELEVLASKERISELESEAVKQDEVETQTSLSLGKMEDTSSVSHTNGETQQGAPGKESDTELENLKGQMSRLFKELQQAQTKLDDAEDMKKSLHDRCRSMEKDLSILRAQLVEKQQVLIENERLKLQLESKKSMVKMEQKKAEDDKCRDSEKDLAMLKAQLAEKQQVETENKKLKLQLEDMQSKVTMEQKKGEDERSRAMEQDLTMLRAQLVEKQQVQTENEKLKLQLESMKSTVKLEQKKAEDERKNMAQVKDEYTKLFEDYNGLKQEMKKKEQPIMSNEEVKELQARLDSAEEALATKQQKIDEMKQEFFKKEKELETISVFQAQAEVYSSDFYAERAAREKIHEEKERLAAQLEYVMKQNSQLQEEMESMGRQSLNEMQRRHMTLGANPHGGGQPGVLGARGTESREWEQPADIPEHACPKCFEVLPDLDSLQIHIMDCII